MAAVPRAGSYPDFSSGGTTNYIERLYARKLLRNYYKKDVISKICNSDASNQSSIKQMGDKVIFRKRPAITINNYYKGKTLSYETPTEDSLELDIDKARDWAFQIDDIDQFQSSVQIMSQYADEGGEKLKETICTDFLADIYDDGNSSNYGATAGAISGNINLGTSGADLVLTRDNILYTFNNMAQVLNEQNIPESDRHVTIPPAVWNMIQSSDLKNSSFSGLDESTLLSNGEAVHRIAGFDIHVTNCVNSATDGTTGNTAFDIVFNQMEAICFCMQITKVEILKQLESTFGSAARGLAVFGYKVLQPKGLGWMYASVQN